MKKLALTLILMTIMVVVCSFGWGGIAYAAVSETECDEVFISTLNELLSAENANDTYFASEKTILYDINIDELGYLYSFTANGEAGFAIVIYTENIYECVEIYFNAVNPYSSATEEDYCVYVNILTYWLYDEGVYFDLSTNDIVPNAVVEAASERAYLSNYPTVELVSEYIYFTYRSENHYRMVNRHPFLMTGVSSCVPTAGANIIQYFDRYAVNLIPNYDPGRAYTSTIYRYKDSSIETNQVVQQLASDMGTTATGTTILKFANGMSKYCSNRGYSFSYSSCMSNNQFNYNTAKQQVNSGKPVALFVDPFTIEIIDNYENYDLIDSIYSTVPHSMVMFGYREISYTLNNGQGRNDTYLMVATGDIFYPSGYCKISSNTTIDEALAVYIG